ncbi:hypothetical protein C900_02808 [Fulvivirga imtechensis AK7]|uniref:DUF6734 domain-containing protein n=1 Tax=Fulvivirga imtechensis AK7 TaxID=1237149 RepID=L8JR61_9BACT|nr:DUF6734 family protein [Fulvivirga imtechensis]ELR71350.1 hypothetical protein C900_02808 [Fulvivirga imtechensis AK7]
MNHKIIQSFWSKPFFDEQSSAEEHRLKGGWPSEKYNYLSWAFSCLQLRKHYNDVELFTDERGKFLLIDELGLPYTNVSTELDNLKDYRSDLWAIGKIYTYSLQNEPFVHIDGDAFLWECLPVELFEEPLIAQNIENEPIMYGELMEKINAKFTDIPEPLRNVDITKGHIYAINAGIIGGSDLEFFKTYTKYVFDFISKNAEHLFWINSGLFNCVYEQLLFYNLAIKNHIKIGYLFPKVTTIPEYTKTFRLVGHKTSYVHTFGVNKKSKFSYMFLDYYMRTLYPEYYNRINRLTETGINWGGVDSFKHSASSRIMETEPLKLYYDNFIVDFINIESPYMTTVFRLSDRTQIIGKEEEISLNMEFTKEDFANFWNNYGQATRIQITGAEGLKVELIPGVYKIILDQFDGKRALREVINNLIGFFLGQQEEIINLMRVVTESGDNNILKSNLESAIKEKAYEFIIDEVIVEDKLLV